MNRRKMFSAAAMFGTAIAGFAQETQVRERSQTIVSGEMGGVAYGPGTFAFVSASAEAGQTVLNAPYSAEAVNETTRVLSDGTRITNKNKTIMARDKEGRTRREASIANIGPWANGAAEAPSFVTVTDPVAKEVYVLNQTERTVRKSKIGEPQVFRTESSASGRREVFESRVQVHTSVGDNLNAITVPVPPPPPGAPMHGVAGAPMHGVAVAAMPAFSFHRFDSKNSKRESLGKQMMEGVQVEGTRVTNTIPAGEIGNDRPIISTEESWFSPELKMVIYSKNVDPQFGETEYRVTNLRRSEPDASMFKVPADYKVMDNKRMEPMMIRKKGAATEI